MTWLRMPLSLAKALSQSETLSYGQAFADSIAVSFKFKFWKALSGNANHGQRARWWYLYPTLKCTFQFTANKVLILRVLAAATEHCCRSHCLCQGPQGVQKPTQAKDLEDFQESRWILCSPLGSWSCLLGAHGLCYNKAQQAPTPVTAQTAWGMTSMSLRKVTSLGSILALVTDLKRIETPHNLCCYFGGYKTFTTRWSGGTVSLSPSSSPCQSSGNLRGSLKAVPEGNQRFRGQLENQRPSSSGCSPALLALVRRASTHTGRFWVGLAAVAAGSNLLAWGKHATTFAILSQFKSQ